MSYEGWSTVSVIQKAMLSYLAATLVGFKTTSLQMNRCIPIFVPCWGHNTPSKTSPTNQYIHASLFWLVAFYQFIHTCGYLPYCPCYCYTLVQNHESLSSVGAPAATNNARMRSSQKLAIQLADTHVAHFLITAWVLSSVGQSASLTWKRSEVRILQDPPSLYTIKHQRPCY